MFAMGLIRGTLRATATSRLFPLARTFSNIQKPELVIKKSFGSLFFQPKVYKTDITKLQAELLEEYKFARVIPPQQAKILENIHTVEPGLSSEELYLDSVLRKRRLKMKKHKLRKRRKAQRALRRKLKKD